MTSMAEANLKRRRSTPNANSRRNSQADALAKVEMKREILAAGLSAAAAAIAASPKSRSAIRAAGLSATESASEAAASMVLNASKLGSLIAEAVAEAAQRVLANTSPKKIVGHTTDRVSLLEGQGIGELISATDLDNRIKELMEEESTDWAASELLGIMEASEKIGVARSTLDQWRRRNKVLAFSKGLRNFVFPMEQFEGSKPLPSLETIRLHLGDDEDAWEWLVTPERVMGNRKPIELLRDGRVDEVIRAAEGALDFA